jgi:hypothetical protein
MDADRLGERLNSLRSELPLPSIWCESDVFVDTLKLDGLTLGMVGLVARRTEDGELVTGSAASRHDHPVERAYYELMERICILDAARDTSRRFNVFDAEGRIVDKCCAQTVFPPAGHDFSYARSNGVAAHHEWSNAMKAAELELIERDRVLRSWYGSLLPVRQPVPSDLQRSLVEDVEWQVYDFPEPARSHIASRAQAAGSTRVAGVLGFPKKATVPLSYGFCAGQDWHQALTGAVTECLQRLAFLWGEELPGEVPVMKCTADYHQEYYLVPEMHERIRAWLRGEHSILALADAQAFARKGDEVRFIDLQPSPSTKNRRPHVLRALDQRRWPLVFGAGHPWVDNARARLVGPHPIA